MKSFEIHAAAGHPDTDEIPEVPLARRCLDAMKADGKNPDLDEVIESVFQQNGVRLTKLEAARQLDGNRQGLSSTSSLAHTASCKAAEASDSANESGDGGDHETASVQHAEAAAAHKRSMDYHLKAEKYHTAKAEGEPAEPLEAE
jgi:hypothetical protein